MIKLFSYIKPEKKLSYSNLRVNFVTQLAHSLVFCLPIWIVYYLRTISIEQLSLIIAFHYLVQIISELPTGAVADLLGKRVSVALGFVMATISYFALIFASSFWHFLIVEFFLGLADSFLSGAVDALVYDSLKQDGEERKFGKVMAEQGFWYQIGLVGATLVGGVLYTKSLYLPFILQAIVLFFAAIYSFKFIEPDVDTEVFTVRNYLRQIKWGAKEIFKNDFLKDFSWYYIWVGAISWTAAIFFNSSMMVDLGFSDVQRGFLQGGLRLFNALVLVKLFENEKIFTSKNSILFFPLVISVAFLPGLLIQGYWALPFVGLAMVSSTARWILLGRIANDEFSSKYRATAISTLSMLIGLLFVIIAGVSGPIIKLGTTRLMYTLLGILGLVTVLPLSFKVLKKIKN